MAEVNEWTEYCMDELMIDERTKAESMGGQMDENTVLLIDTQTLTHG